jgi:hypothetical protein
MWSLDEITVDILEAEHPVAVVRITTPAAASR